MRGKLVEQDPNDEPAAELLKRVQAGRERLVKEQKIKKLISFDEEDVLISLPTSWCWARFIEVAAIESNLVKPDGFPDYPHIAPDNIEGYTGRLLNYQTIRAYGSLKFEGVLHIVVRSRYERDLDYPQ